MVLARALDRVGCKNAKTQFVQGSGRIEMSIPAARLWKTPRSNIHTHTVPIAFPLPQHHSNTITQANTMRVSASLVALLGLAGSALAAPQMGLVK